MTRIPSTIDVDSLSFTLVHQTVSPCERVWSGDETRG